MTLILSEATLRWALQVSDRLLTLAGTSPPERHDVAANKAILLGASNGMASLAYTGLGYVEDAPTDSWLAAQLVGPELAFDPAEPKFSMRMVTGRRPWPTMGTKLRQLANALTRAVPRGRSKFRVSVSVTGWLWYRKKRPRAFLALVAPDATGAYQAHWLPRFYARAFRLLVSPRGYVSREVQAELTAALTRISDPGEASQLFIRLIRSVAESFPTVGGDCMVVEIDHPWVQDPGIRIRYDPLPKDPRNPLGPFNPSYSPWVITRGHCHPPTLMIGGGLSFRAPPYSITLTGRRQDDGPRVFFVEAQPRRGKP